MKHGMTEYRNTSFSNLNDLSDTSTTYLASLYEACNAQSSREGFLNAFSHANKNLCASVISSILVAMAIPQQSRDFQDIFMKICMLLYVLSVLRLTGNAYNQNASLLKFIQRTVDTSFFLPLHYHVDTTLTQHYHPSLQ